MPARRTDQSKIVEQARKGLATWKRARKCAVQLWKDDVSIAEIVDLMNVAKQWVHKWIRRFKTHGKTWESLDDKSCRPRTIHVKRHAHVDEVLEARTKFPHLGAKKLKIVATIPLSHDTINRILVENRAVTQRKKTWRKYKRFQRPFPNYLWQMDITQVSLENGPWVHILTIIDDHSRFILASKTFDKELTSADVLSVVRQTIITWGKPRQILTDRGCQFTTNSDYPGIFSLALHELGIQHIKARPRHPRTLGKIERWHRSLKHEWLANHPTAKTQDELRLILHAWLDHYNSERPHFALRYRLPVDVYMAGFMTPEAVYRLVNEVA